MRACGQRTMDVDPEGGITMWDRRLRAGQAFDCRRPKVVSERLGHATVSITLGTYSHAIPAMQEEAAVRVGAGSRPRISR